MDQRRTENTLSTNRQSDLEREYKDEFRDGTRVDAIEIIEAKVATFQKSNEKQLSPVDQLKAYRLACFIFEVRITDTWNLLSWVGTNNLFLYCLSYMYIDGHAQEVKIQSCKK